MYAMASPRMTGSGINSGSRPLSTRRTMPIITTSKAMRGMNEIACVAYSGTAANIVSSRNSISRRRSLIASPH